MDHMLVRLVATLIVFGLLVLVIAS